MEPATYFTTTKEPSDLQEKLTKVQTFLNQHKGQKVVLISSGGTTVPLEQNVVRFLDNFSAGTRGSASAEYFLESGYNVIFLHRLYSLEPFTRSISKRSVLDFLQIKQGHLGVKSENESKLTALLQKYEKYQSNLLKIDFVTLKDYLFLLRGITQALAPCQKYAMFYLAAAVSDFYIPDEKMQVHKIQSGNGGLHIDMEPVPKIIKPLVSEWSSSAYVVSFKLETDESLLIPKCKASLDRYGHQLVIGNMLHTRKHSVKLVTPDSMEDINLTSEQLKSMEIESLLVKQLVQRHQEWINKMP